MVDLCFDCGIIYNKNWQQVSCSGIGDELGKYEYLLHYHVAVEYWNCEGQVKAGKITYQRMKKVENKTVHISATTCACVKSLEYYNKYYNHCHVKEIAF